MKRIALTLLFTIVLTYCGFTQTKNFIDQPYLETNARVDTLVTPDKIYLSILITEADTKGKTSVEELENKMANKLKAMGIDLDKQLTLSDLSSNFKKYFLRRQDVLKSKAYTLEVYDALTAGKVMLELENLNISNVNIQKVEYSKMEQLKLILKSKAMIMAKDNAIALTKPLGQKVGPAIFISDVSNLSYQRYDMAPTMLAKGMVESREAQAQPLDIEFKKISVDVTVNVKFKIE